MRSFRIIPVLVVVALLVALTSSWQGDGAATDDQLRVPAIPAGSSPTALSSSWFCAAGTAVGLGSATHLLVLTNPSDAPIEARVTAYGAEGEVGSQVVEVAAASNDWVRVADLFGGDDLSVMVESSSGELAVEHSLSTARTADQVPCATASSERWYFPVQSTALEAIGPDETRPADAVPNSATLVLFNPFSADAAVDISAAIEDGIRVPGEWAGLVVPAGTTRTIDLSDRIDRREVFSLSVRLRTGRVIAETAQTFVHDNEVSGVRLQGGVPRAESRWAFAAGFTGSGATEQLVVYNPSEAPASVIVQVTPVGGAELPPEPFELEVTGRRYRVVDLSQEGRVPGVGHHSIQVESGADTPVVVGRMTTVTGPPAAAADEPDEEADGGATADPDVVPRPSIRSGTTISTGTPMASTRWLVPWMFLGGDQDPALIVHNPGAEPVRVSVTTLGGEEAGTTLADAIEVAPGDGVVLPMADSELPDGRVGMAVTSDAPVVVERVLTFADQGDLSMGLAIPYPPEGSGRFTLISEL